MGVLEILEIQGMGDLVLRRTVSGQYLVYFIASNLDVGTCDYYLGESESEAKRIFSIEKQSYSELERKINTIRKGA